MDTLAAIGRWLSKQHVVTWCVSREDELWCANAFYVYDPDTVAFYLLSEEHTRHGQMTGQRAKVAGTVNGQPKTVALIRGVQFKGEIRRLSGDEEARMRQRYVKRFPVARMLSAPSRRSASRLKAGRSSGVLLVTSCSLSTTTSWS